MNKNDFLRHHHGEEHLFIRNLHYLNVSESGFAGHTTQFCTDLRSSASGGATSHEFPRSPAHLGGEKLNIQISPRVSHICAGD
jgi:hypothetical protein